jgi:hypothetical protein
MKYIKKYEMFQNTLSEYKKESHSLPSYEECVEMCNKIDSPFYESKMVIDGYG